MTKAEEQADTILCKNCKNSQSKEYVCGMRRSKEFCVLTRNFILGYEQAEKDINKELMDKMNEIREKQEKALLSNIDYVVHFEPSAGFDTGSVVVYHNDKD